VLLRASSEAAGAGVELGAIAGGGAESGVPCGGPLLRFAEAVVRGGEEELSGARRELLAAVGPERLVEAAAVAANFERMVRIADATGIPLDPPLAALGADVVAELDLGRFGSAANTKPPGRLARALAPLLRRLAPRLLSRAAGGRASRPASGSRG
jgi:hypothetical protein